MDAAPIAPTSHRLAAKASFIGAPVANIVGSILKPALTSKPFLMMYSVGKLVMKGIVATLSTGKSPVFSASLCSIFFVSPSALLSELPLLPQAIKEAAIPTANIIAKNLFFFIFKILPSPFYFIICYQPYLYFLFSLLFFLIFSNKKGKYCFFYFPFVF